MLERFLNKGMRVYALENLNFSFGLKCIIKRKERIEVIIIIKCGI
jgi:hypothetical protein